MFEDVRAQYYPHPIGDGIIVKPIATRSDFFDITGALFDGVFTPFDELGSYSLPQERGANLTPLRQAFAGTHHEYFVFYDGDTVAGWSYGEMHDPETYFMANTAVLPAYQRRGIYSAYLSHFIQYLTALGYERITSTHQPNNRAVLMAKLKAGFVLSGMILDERWSAQVQMTYHVYPDRQRGFERAFSLELIHRD